MNANATIQSPTVSREGQRVLTFRRDGQRCANFSRGGSRFSVPIWTCGEYVAQARQRDGVVTWRLARSFGPSLSGQSPAAGVLAHLDHIAQETGLPIVHVSHGQRVAV